jgi:hypothetical protein
MIASLRVETGLELHPRCLCSENHFTDGRETPNRMEYLLDNESRGHHLEGSKRMENLHGFGNQLPFVVTDEFVAGADLPPEPNQRRKHSIRRPLRQGAGLDGFRRATPECADRELTGGASFCGDRKVHNNLGFHFDGLTVLVVGLIPPFFDCL